MSVITQIQSYLRAHGDGHGVGQQVDSLQHEGASLSAELHLLGVASCEVRSQRPAHGPHLLHDRWKTKHLCGEKRQITSALRKEAMRR